jgi:hypothetical protein
MTVPPKAGLTIGWARVSRYDAPATPEKKGTIR